MTIFLRDIWQISNPDSYKAHFARWNQHNEPLEVLARDQQEWQGWQQYWPGRNEFNRQYIFALAKFYHEPDIWIFGGVFRVLGHNSEEYQVELTELGSNFIGRLKLRSPYRSRPTRLNFEDHYNSFEVDEVLKERYTGRHFPGYEDIDVSFEELETLVRNSRPDWRTALASIKGIYQITDVSTGLCYIGSAYGEGGVWSRWCSYAETGHGGNTELRNLVRDPSLAYCRANFRFALLDHRSNRTTDEVILAREAFFKRVLMTRGERGMNRN
jgi:hypothetical protein